MKTKAHSMLAMPSSSDLTRLQKALSDLSQRLNGQPAISVILPAFNEEGTVGSVIYNTEKVLRMLLQDYELIVIDDGSTDGTSTIASSNGAIVINHNSNLGKGCAIRKGFEKAKGSIIVTIDTDGGHEPKEIPKLLYPLLDGDNADVVIGSRFLGNIEYGSIPKLNLLGNMIINLLLSLFTGKRLSDSQSGFRAFKREVIDELTVDSRGFEVETEIICKILRRRLRVKEIPITCKSRNGSASKLNPLRDGLRILGTIFRFSLAD